jgi:hemerythrin-like domain-containing protein
MNPIEELKIEHRAIETALAILSRISHDPAQRPASDVARDAGRLIEFFKVFADACHHAKEEGHLFPVLEQMGVSRDGGPIGVMLAEHEQGRRLIRQMDASLGRVETDGQPAWEAFRKAAATYVDLMHRHIFKEDHVLFEIARQRLSKVRMQRLAVDFQRLEREKIGAGRHEAFHRLLDELAQTCDVGQAEKAAGHRG